MQASEEFLSCTFLMMGDKLEDIQFSKAVTMLVRLSWHKRRQKAPEGALGFRVLIWDLAL